MSNEAAGTFTRPAPAGEAPAGQHWAAVESDSQWSVVPDPEPGAEPRTCRLRAAQAMKACGEPATVRVRRGISRVVDWHYCAADAYAQYGQWAENGKVYHYELRRGAARDR